MFYVGHTENYSNVFHQTTSDPGKIAVAFYAGIFSFSGWNYLNFMTEELRDPYVYEFFEFQYHNFFSVNDY